MSDDNVKLLSSTVEELAKAVKKAWDTNRQIVPIVGAGLSADCGFPVITAVVRYFGKLQQYIEKRVSLPQYSGASKMLSLDRYFEEYKKKPWLYIEDFGWPDRFQLNQDLFAKLQKDSSMAPKGERIEPERLIEYAVREGLEQMLQNVNKAGFMAYKELQKDITSNADESGYKDFNNTINKRFKENWSRSVAFDVVGDWRQLILYFTNYQSDYADGLFARFGAMRKPGQGHRFLAFLVKLLVVPTVFTFNFDSLIEQALETEGVWPRVFAMERGASLPYPGLVRDQLSVIKMHGSTHALLLDEQLDRPLTPEYLQRFDKITGPNPLLLVVGCSEGDRRLRDLVTHVVTRPFEDTSVIWLHYENEPPPFLNELLKNIEVRREKIYICPTNNPGATLLHIYSWLTSCNPASHVPYLAHVQHPIQLGKSREDRLADEPKWDKCRRFEVLSSLPAEESHSPACQQLLTMANYWARNGYQFIWVDLESVHTFAGVVGTIIDQCRKYDPDLAPSVLPADIDSEKQKSLRGDVIKLAAQRVARALRRTRYFLAFDGMETYVWPATTHHGLTHMAIQRGGAIHLTNLCDFLKQLKGEDVGESRIGVSVDFPKSRHSDKDPGKYLSSYLPLEDVISQLQEKSSVSVTPPVSSTVNFDSLFENPKEDIPLISLKTLPERLTGIISSNEKGEPVDLESQKLRLALVLFTLSCFRRTRPLVAIRHLLEPVLGSKDSDGMPVVDKVLRQFTRRRGSDDDEFCFLEQLEGGGFWFNHTV